MPDKKVIVLGDIKICKQCGKPFVPSLSHKNKCDKCIKEMIKICISEVNKLDW